jgi:hypothetical protein
MELIERCWPSRATRIAEADPAAALRIAEIFLEAIVSLPDDTDTNEGAHE